MSEKNRCPSLRENEYCIGKSCADVACLWHPLKVLEGDYNEKKGS